MKTYTTFYNGDEPFRVVVDENNVRVYKNGNGKQDDELLYTLKDVIKVFPAKDPFEARDFGAVVIQTSVRTYFYVCNEIYTFVVEHDEQIKEVLAPTYTRTVPYPYAVTEKNFYLLLSGVKLPMSMHENQSGIEDDCYRLYYGLPVHIQEALKKIDCTVLVKKMTTYNNTYFFAAKKC